MARRHLNPGDRIPGSRYVRAYCTCCGEPIRVTDLTTSPQSCDQCLGKVSRNRAKARGAPIDDTMGYQANAIKAMDGD